MPTRMIRGGRLLLPDGVLENYALIYDKKIQGILPDSQLEGLPFDEVIDVQGTIISPGFINIHIHGAGGADVMDGTEDALKTIGRFLQTSGVTAYLPTTLTAACGQIEKTLEVIRKVQKEPSSGASILGVHLEGPFINPKYKGAHDERFILPPDADWVHHHRDILKIVTYAPEMDESGDFTRALCHSGIIPSLGHSGATCECALGAVKSGARSFTHLFNAMSPLHHREPGMVGAALTSESWVELIADNIHVSPVLYELICKAKGISKVILITDSIRAAGLPEGEYELGGLPVTVKDGAARLTSSGVLAGSVLKMGDGIKNVMEATKRPLLEIIRMATINPATLLGIQEKKGILAQGADADFVFLDPDCRILKTIQAGEVVYSC